MALHLNHKYEMHFDISQETLHFPDSIDSTNLLPKRWYQLRNFAIFNQACACSCIVLTKDLLFLLVIGVSRIKDLLYNVDIRIMFTFQGRVLVKRAQKSAFYVHGYVLHIYLSHG